MPPRYPDLACPVGSHSQSVWPFVAIMGSGLALTTGVDFAFLPGHPPRMFGHLLLVPFSPLASLMSGLLRDDLDRQMLAPRQQVITLRRQLGKRPRLSRAEKLALLLTCVRMKQTRLLDCLMIIRPATLVRWHRQIVRHHWTFQSMRRPGRPRTAPQAEQLVLRLARENACWGCGKIAGEMRKLGFVRFGRSTVQRILERHGLWPRPRQAGLNWHDFLGHYGQFIWACDFFTVTTAALRTYGTICAGCSGSSSATTTSADHIVRWGRRRRRDQRSIPARAKCAATRYSPDSSTTTTGRPPDRPAETLTVPFCLPEAIARARPLCLQTSVTSALGTLLCPEPHPSNQQKALQRTSAITKALRRLPVDRKKRVQC